MEDEQKAITKAHLEENPDVRMDECACVSHKLCLL